jgi:hypothetical protein
MVQIQVSADECPKVERVVLVETEVVGKRFHRLTLEWKLNGQPVEGWIRVFNHSVTSGEGFHWHVPSAYGQPMVMQDATIVWALWERDAAAAAAFVEQAVEGANTEFEESSALPIGK